jgi:hypothetical protein
MSDIFGLNLKYLPAVLRHGIFLKWLTVNFQKSMAPVELG